MPHTTILLLYVFQFSKSETHLYLTIIYFFALYLLFLSPLLSLILDILTAENHLFKFCVIFYVNKNLKYVNEVSITL